MMKRFIIGALAALIIALGTASLAQAYPTKPGSTDPLSV